MHPHSRKLLTIVTETALEDRMCEILRSMGASGYTITDARGKGSRGVRGAGWSISSNIRIEVICEETVGKKIADHLRENYYRDYAMILYVSEVDVLRPEKF